MSVSSDLGIVLFASGDGSGSYTRVDGNPGVVRTLTNANFIASDWLDAGRMGELFVTISGVISGAMASVTVRLERRRSDDNNPTLFNPALIATSRMDDPAAAKATQQIITSTELVGQNVSAWPDAAPGAETLDVVLRTRDQRWAGQCRVLIQATGVSQPSDQVIVAINGGG